MRTSHTRRVLRALISANRRFNEKRSWVMCSHVAMSMLLALFPFLLFVVALAGALTEGVHAEEFIQLVIGGWPDEIADPIAGEVRAVMSSQTGGLLTLGAVLALYFASNGVDALRAAMTRTYRGFDPRPWWRQRLLCLAFVLGGSVVLVVVVLVSVAAPLYFQFVIDKAPRLSLSMFGNDIMARALTGLFLVLAVTACHVWLPGIHRRVAHIWPGILLTVVLWAAAGYGFSYYLERFASYSATYAGLAGAMSALIYLNLMSAILIYGAELNGALGDVDGSGDVDRASDAD